MGAASVGENPSHSESDGTGAAVPGGGPVPGSWPVAAAAPAARVTSEYRETAFFDAAGRLVFRTEPVGESRGTLVLASSLFAEFQRNYRREVLVARAAAADGITSLRFHYRGAGNSLAGGPPTLDTMTEDLAEVVSEVTGPVVLCGTRLGALAVARLRARLDVPVVLWEPVLDGARWVEEVIRACLAREVAQGVTVNADAVRARWASDGVVFVLGETVPAGIVEQVGAADLAAEMVGEAPVLLVQMGRNDRMRPDIDKAGLALAERGMTVSVLPVVGRQTWWVNEGGDLFRPLERDEATGTLIDGILAFVGSSLP
jgi:hypothetical protein